VEKNRIQLFKVNVMPLVKIELSKGSNAEFLSVLQEQTMNAVAKALGLLEDDRNVRLIEYDNTNFSMKNPYKILIEITMFSGRTDVTKKMLFKEIVSNLTNSLNIQAAELFIVLNEQPKSNWGVRGGIPACEIELGFKVDV
jgi:phenylpyruvate tautomerase PptA (4-oxalocrotonate tautomerase family)